MSRIDQSRSNQSTPAKLLEARRYGPPPFLVRNLKYVAEDRKASRGRLWDLNWSRSDYRSALGPRHLTLTVNASRCIVSETTERNTFMGTASASRHPREALLHLTLLARQQDGTKFCFATRHSSIRIWVPKEDDEFSNVTLDDIPFSVHFDLSSYFSLLSAELTQLSLIVRISSIDAPPPPAHEANSGKIRAIVGSLVLWKDGKSRFGTAVANEKVNVPLRFGVLKDPLTNDDLQNVPSIHLGDPSKRFDSSIQLDINGEIHHQITKAVEKEKPKIFVTLRYTSAQFPNWDGFVRHNFMCPWCPRNCHRFRTLLSHFQVDHSNFRFSLEGIDSHTGLIDASSNTVPFTVQLEVTPMANDAHHGHRSNRGDTEDGMADDAYEEGVEIYVNPRRYRHYVDKSNEARDNAAMEAGLRSVNLDGDSGSDSTVFDQERGNDLLSIVRDELWNFCSHCGRRHDCSYNGKDDFCSEWCEISHKKDLEASNEGKPLLANASVPRASKVNYKEALGKLQLYHIVSVTEMKEDHYDEDDPDSEEEVDQSWRLDLNIERVRSLEGVSAKEKTLWMLWNKYAYENYPIASLYGERYTRHTLEVFVLDKKAEIEQLKLRTQLFGFLRALHVHGLLDSKAILSIMMCLNGQKKRRDIGVSSRPEAPTDRRGGTQGNGRSRRGARRK